MKAVYQVSDIPLGDVVVSQRSHGIKGVIQYDFRKTGASGPLMQTGCLNAIPPVLFNVIAEVQAHHLTGRTMIPDYLSLFNESQKFTRQNASPGIVSRSKYQHVDGPVRKHRSILGQNLRRQIAFLFYNISATWWA